MTRWLSFAQWACLVLLLAGAANMGGLAAGAENGRGADKGRKPDVRGYLTESSVARAASPCPAVQNAVGYYRRQYTASRQRMGLEGAPARAWYPCNAAKKRAVEWRNRAASARRALGVWKTYQYAWWTWMPRGSKWWRVASCETGYGRDPNWSHDSGAYVSAFGIYRAGYADDAHRVGNLSWDETIRLRGTVPTPREQYEAAVSHYNAHGGYSGWGCRGA